MSKPPDEIVALIALPPEKTNSVPPLATFVSTALPPLETLTKPLSIVLITVPPDSTFRVPPESTMTPELVWPADTFSVWPGRTVVLMPFGLHDRRSGAGRRSKSIVSRISASGSRRSRCVQWEKLPPLGRCLATVAVSSASTVIMALVSARPPLSTGDIPPPSLPCLDGSELGLSREGNGVTLRGWHYPSRGVGQSCTRREGTAIRRHKCVGAPRDRPLNRAGGLAILSSLGGVAGRASFSGRPSLTPSP